MFKIDARVIKNPITKDTTTQGKTGINKFIRNLIHRFP